MANQRLRRAVRRVLATSAAATTVVAGSVMAQDQEAGVTETVVVTGTRLSRPDLESNSPLSTVSADEIRLQGSVNVEEVLLDLPQTVPGVSSTTNNGGDGTTTVNLRGLGSQRTLVLVDGKRFIPSDQGGAADLNALPVSLIERIDVVTGGASAVYGSDAMAGVVNMIMKKNFQGIQLDTQYGQTGESDGDQVDVNVLVGNNFADGAGNVTAYAGYTQRDEIFQGDREFSSFALTEDAANPGTLIQQGSPTTDVGGFGIGNPALDIDGDGVVGVDANGNLTDPLQYYNFAPVNYLQIPQERYIIGAMGNYEVNQYAEAFARVAYANNTSKTQIAASGTFYDSFDVNPENPFIPAATLDAFRAEAGVTDPDALIPVSIGKRIVELGGRRQDFERSAFQTLAGLRGDLGGSWGYEAFFQYGQTNLSTFLAGDISATRVQQSLLAEQGANGPQCVDPSGGCVPANFFTSNPLDALAAEFISLNLTAVNTTTQTVGGGSVTGDLFQIPMATNPVGIAFGAEYREETADFRPDDNLATGNNVGFGSSPPVAGSYNVREAFVEMIVPLVEDAAFAKRLALDLGYRISDYNNIEDKVDTYKYGLEWAPIDDIRFRGMFQRAVRAPNIQELFNPQVESADSAADPCAGAAGAGALAALCQATGVPANRIGTVPICPAGQCQSFLGGNPDLGVETADTITFGFVLNPRFIQNFSMTVDYYDIDIEGAIEAFGGSIQNVLDQCYTVAADASSPFCQVIRRNPTTGSIFGDEFGVDLLSQNIGFRNTAGVDLQFNYRLDMGESGFLGFAFSGTRVLKNEVQADPSSPINECEGTFGLICGPNVDVDPETRFNFRTTWGWRDLNLSLRLRYISSVELDRLKLGTDSNGIAAVSEIESFSWLDLQGSYALTDEIQLSFGVNNLLDEDPPIIGADSSGPSNNGSANTFPATYDALGQEIYVGMKVNF